MKNKGKVNIVIVFVFDKDEIEKNRHLKSFIPSGIIDEKRAPFMYFSNEMFEELNKDGVDISCYYYPWAMTELTERSPLDIAENLTGVILDKFSGLEPNEKEYFIFGIDDPHEKTFDGLVASLIMAKDDEKEFEVTVIDPYKQGSYMGVMVDLEPFLLREQKIKIDVQNWN